MLENDMLLVAGLGVAVVLCRKRCLSPTRTRKTKKPTNTSQLQQLTTLHPRLWIVERRTLNFVRYDYWYARKMLALR